MAVFEYNDYKKYFRDIIEAKGPKGHGEYKRLAEFLNIHPTFISQVLSGKKDFAAEQILQVAKYYGLGKTESRYLFLLVEIERAGSKDHRDHLVEMRDDLKRQSLKISKRVQSDREMTDLEKSIFYSSWVYSAVHLLTTLDRPVDFDFICRRLNLSNERVREILEFLKGINLLQEDSGILKPSGIKTHLAKGSPFLIKHHVNWRVKALEKSENLSEEELMYSVNVSLNQKDYQKLREEIVEFIQKFLKTVHASPADDLAQLNIDFFWV